MRDKHYPFDFQLRVLARLCTTAAAVLSLGFLSPRSVTAQEIAISCTVLPVGSCEDPIQADSAVQSRNIRVTVTRGGKPASGVLVSFYATSGRVFADSIVTDTTGIVNASWTRARDSSAAVITIAAVTRSGSASYLLSLVPRSGAGKQQLVLENWTHTRSWFEKYALPNPIPVAIKELTKEGTSAFIRDRQKCQAQKVVFLGNARAGTASPDTVTGELYSVYRNRRNERSKQIKSLSPQELTRKAANDSACFVFTSWTLGETPGAKELRAKIIPKGYDAPYTLNIKGNARALPRFVGGFALSRNKGYRGLKKGSEKAIHVERLMPDGSKQTFDSIVTAPNSVDTVRSKYGSSAIAGVSIALPLWWLGKFDRLSFTGGIDLGSPRDDFYAGGSLARLFGPAVEALPLDVHLLAHFGRQEFLKDPAACAAGGSCATKKKMRIQGPAFMLSADATTLISEIIKRLAP
jgi:hypothetical protein